MLVLTMKESPTPASTATDKKLEEQIRCHAHEIYKTRGRGNSPDLENWFPAEVDTGNATSSTTP